MAPIAQKVPIRACVALPPLSTERESAASQVHEVLDLLWPGRCGKAAALRGDEPLGTEGLRLDSIEIVELVLECQLRAGVPADRTEDLLDGGPLTVGALI